MAPASKSSFPDSVSRALYGAGEVPRHRPREERVMRSKYDAAQDDTGNERHWRDADGYSGRKANSPDVRKNLRERARQEFDNGGTCKGPVETIGHDMIGTGARLQLQPPEGVPQDVARVIERSFQAWCDDPAVDYADACRIAVESELRDGEAFGLLTTNAGVGHPVKLAVRVVETEQVCTPDLFDSESSRKVDGIEFDADGNPLRYAVLKEHPGDGLTFAYDPSAYNWWPASEVMHWFRASRASHARGIPRYTAGLPLHAHKRAFTRSVLGAARIAAMFAGVLKTNLPPENGPAVVQAYDEVPFDHDGLLTMPEGWEASQFKAEQPTATHKDFSDSLATEFGRAIHAPRNIVTGDSSPYNYSSARLDHIIYRGALKVARNRFAIRWHDRVFAAWFAEAVVVLPGLAGLPPLAEWSWAWRYDAFPSIDPVKDATAAEIEQRIGLLNYADALADRGIDWREHFRQKAREREFARAEGVEDLFFPVKAPAQGAAGGAADPEAMRAQIRAMVQDEIDTVLEDRGVSYAR